MRGTRNVSRVAHTLCPKKANGKYMWRRTYFFGIRPSPKSRAKPLGTFYAYPEVLHRAAFYSQPFGRRLLPFNKLRTNG